MMTERETNRRNEVTGRPWAVDELFLLDRGNESRQNGGDARFQDAALELHNLRAALTAEVTQREVAERRAVEAEAAIMAISAVTLGEPVSEFEETLHGVRLAQDLRAERDTLAAAPKALIAALRQRIDDCERDGLCEPAHVRGLEEAIEVVQAHHA